MRAETRAQPGGSLVPPWRRGATEGANDRAISRVATVEIDDPYVRVREVRDVRDGVVGIDGEGVEGSPSAGDDAVDTVLAAVDDASVELAAERQRRSIEQDAFDNIWRGE